MVRDDVGYLVIISMIAACMLVMNSALLVCGRLYMFMMVCIGLFFWVVLWMWIIIIAALSICMSSVVVVCKFCLL